MYRPGLGVSDHRCFASGRRENADNALMSPKRQQMIARVARAGVASAALCVAVAAHAQSIEPARFVAPSNVVSVAAPSGILAATPAVVAPQTRPLPVQNSST